MAGNDPTPWLAGNLAMLGETIAPHTYAVKMWDGTLSSDQRVDIPAYDVQITLSATRVPFGTATFKTPIPPWPGVTWPVGAVLQGVPSTIWRVTPVVIIAGWTLPGGDDRHSMLNGLVTSAEVQRGADGTSYVQWTVETADRLWEYPSHRTYTPSNTYTRVKQVTDAVNGSADRWYVDPVITEGTLNTPSAGQLASFQACDIGIGDTIGDYLRQLAQLLGQRVRPDWRNNTLRLRVDAEPAYDTGAALTIASAAEVTETYSYDNWGTILDLRAQWYSSGDEKTATRQFAYPGMFPNSPTRGTAPAVAQSKTIYTKPPGGTIPNDANWPPAAQWINRLSRNAGLYQATSRAAWWITPLDVITYTQPGLTIVADTITFDLDAGLMTTTGFKP